MEGQPAPTQQASARPSPDEQPSRIAAISSASPVGHASPGTGPRVEALRAVWRAAAWLRVNLPAAYRVRRMPATLQRLGMAMAEGA